MKIFYTAILFLMLQTFAQPVAAAPFVATYWGEQWKTHEFALNFNYWREDETMILHVKNGELLCYAGGKATNLWDYDLIPIVNKIWEYNGTQDMKNVDSEFSPKLFANTDKPEPGIVLMRYYDPTMDSLHHNRYDLTGNPELVKHVNETAKRYCAGERAPESKTKKNEDPHQFDGKIPDPSRQSI